VRKTVSRRELKALSIQRNGDGASRPRSALGVEESVQVPGTAGAAPETATGEGHRIRIFFGMSFTIVEVSSVHA
jgi:hypothetical protein